MNKCISFFILPILLLSCGRSDSPDIPPSLSLQVSKRVANTENWAARDPLLNDVPTKLRADGSADNGDGLLWAGILCSADQAKFASSCQYVADSQGSDGRMWRSPTRVDKEDKNTFSRDMAMGLLLAVQATGDVVMLQRWVDYVTENELACPVADDNRCQMTTNIWSLAKIAAPEVDLGGHILLTPKQLLIVLYGAASTSDGGFPLHLIAQQLILLKRAGEGNALIWRKTAELLHDREPSNALFAYLAGKSERASVLIMEQLPTDRPIGASQWSFERVGTQQAWKHSMGWEYIWLHALMSK